MRALLSREPGGPGTLRIEEVPDPVPGPGEVVVRVRACGVNYPDLLVIQDLYQFKPPRPFSPGGEVAGEVERVGAGVTGLKAGDRVVALTMHGGMAERVAVAAERCLSVPADMPFTDAATFIFTYGTAYHALKNRAGLESGETLLVLGAAGGVGLAAVELGKAMGARVVAAASSLAKAALADERGADDAVVYPAGPFDKMSARLLADLFKAACGTKGADVIFDPVGGAYAEAALRAIAWEGRFLVVGFPAGIPHIPLNLPLLKSCQIIGVFWGEFTRRAPEISAANNTALFDLYREGAIRPHVSERFPLERGAEAIRRIAERGALGKLVVTMDAP